MKIIKYSLLLGVASAFLLSSNLSAEEGVEPEIGSLFDDVDSGSRFEAEKPQLPAQGKKTKKKLTADEIAAKKAAGEAKRNERNNKKNNVEASDLDTSINETVVELPKIDIDNALAALEQAKAALEDTKQKAADQDEAKKAEIAAEEQKTKDASELTRLRGITPEDHRKAAEEKILADHQHKFATPLVTSSDGAVEVTPTHENEINADQAKQLREMGVGTDIKAELIGQEPMPVANNDNETLSAQEPETKVDDATEQQADAEQPVAVADKKEKKVKPKKEKKKLTDEDKAEKKAAGEAKRNEREAKRNASQEDDLDTSLNDRKSRKKLTDEEKSAHEERMRSQKEAKQSKKSDKKAANEKKKADQIAAKDKKSAERKERKEANKDKDYTALLNESDTPDGESN